MLLLLLIDTAAAGWGKQDGAPTTASVWSLCVLTRSDKQPDRVEISAVQLSEAADEAEMSGVELWRVRSLFQPFCFDVCCMPRALAAAEDAPARPHHRLDAFSPPHQRVGFPCRCVAGPRPLPPPPTH